MMMEEIVNEDMNIRQCAMEHGIPKSTLNYNLNRICRELEHDGYFSVIAYKYREKMSEHFKIKHINRGKATAEMKKKIRDKQS